MTTYTEAKARRHEVEMLRKEILTGGDAIAYLDRRLAELEQQVLLAAFDA